MLQDQFVTALYEGILKLWISIDAPNISERITIHQLWEIAREWLHRIGNALDKRSEAVAFAKRPVKVYIEFLDHDLEDICKEKPTVGELLSLCGVEPHEEPHACKAVFQAGFLDGSRIAENIVERLFVRTLTHAYLHLLGAEDCEREAEEIERLIVPNNEARSSIFFRRENLLILFVIH